MDPRLEAFLDPRFCYVFSQNPARVRSKSDAIAAGLNCIALAHLVIADLFGFQLPAELQSLELSSDDAHFESLGWPTDLASGDLIWLGTNQPLIDLAEFTPRYDGNNLLNFNEFPINHVAIATGERREGDALLLHASPIDGTNALWPLHRFIEHERYGRIYKVMRLRDAFKVSKGID